MKINCPYCTKEFEFDPDNLEWHKRGRQKKCPVCNKKIIFEMPANHLIRDKETGALRKKFPSAK